MYLQYMSFECYMNVLLNLNTDSLNSKVVLVRKIKATDFLEVIL